MPKPKAPEPDPDEILQLQIRLPRSTHSLLRAAAFGDRRSLSAMARVLIDDGARIAIMRQKQEAARQRKLARAEREARP